MIDSHKAYQSNNLVVDVSVFDVICVVFPTTLGATLMDCVSKSIVTRHDHGYRPFLMLTCI